MGTPENLGYSPTYFLERDCSVHDGGAGDGYHTQEELRTVIQHDIDSYERNGRRSSDWDRVQESRRMLDAMKGAGYDAVDYLPDNLRNVAKELRQRAVDLMKVAYEIGDGTVDQAVLDRARLNYNSQMGRGSLSRERGEQMLREVQQVADYLHLR